DAFWTSDECGVSGAADGKLRAYSLRAHSFGKASGMWDMRLLVREVFDPAQLSGGPEGSKTKRRRIGRLERRNRKGRLQTGREDGAGPGRASAAAYVSAKIDVVVGALMRRLAVEVDRVARELRLLDLDRRSEARDAR